ncbi:hypothetical protein FM119_08770 [Mycetocola reblochoni REB411]|uniref:Phage capsid and scaffold n=1 Tax=Mycetocola reblochoni REB411 TaxID=1255698 RepID=A0A1R4JQ32_9MICO|nr:hypothetical protein FM119_08770 [Mycetocola reblochoni REB411]
MKGDADDYIRELRDEAKQRRIAAETLTKERDEAATARDAVTAERDTLARQNAVILASQGLGANAAAILDSRALESKLAAVDPSDPDAVKAFITEAMEANAAFKTGPVIPSRNGGAHQGGTPAAQPLSLDAAVRGALGG